MQKIVRKGGKQLVMSNKTQITSTKVREFLDAVTAPRQAEDARVLDAMYRDITEFQL